MTVLLQLFDEGRLTDGRGKTVECKEAVFIMTSNLGSNEIAEYAIRLREDSEELRTEQGNAEDGQLATKDPCDSITFPKKFREEVVEPKLKKHFRRDEFLGRINEIVYFVPFSRTQLLQLVNKDLTFWQQRARTRHQVELQWDDDLVEAVADGYNVYYGARSIKHEVERRVINPLAAAYERLLIRKGNIVKLTAEPHIHVHDAHGQCKCEPRLLRVLVADTPVDDNNKTKEFVDITGTLNEVLPVEAT